LARLILREYSEEDKRDLVKLLQHGLTKNFTTERWNWLHHNIVTLGSYIVVALYDNRIVGTVGAIRKKFTYNNERFVGGRHIDPVVDKSMRGKGVFTKMLYALNEMCNDVNFSYTFPNAASFPGFAKTGYTSVGPIFVPSCQLSFLNVAIKEKVRYLTSGIKTVGRKDTSIIQGSFDELKEAVPVTPKNKYALMRDYSYIKWRYADSPIKSYEVLISKLNKTIQNACIVLKNDRLISIMDFIEYQSEISILDYLTAIKKIYGKVTVSVWDSSISDIHKFFVGKSTQNFLVHKGNLKMPERVFDKSFWFITKGEVEGN